MLVLQCQIISIINIINESSLNFTIRSNSMQPVPEKEERSESNPSPNKSSSNYSEKRVQISNNNKQRPSRKWKHRESRIYCEFLRDNFTIFQSSQERKKYRVFSALSRLIQTRTVAQVKSHHQKMMRKYKQSLKDLLIGIEKKLAEKIQYSDEEAPREFNQKQQLQPEMAPIENNENQLILEAMHEEEKEVKELEKDDEGEDIEDIIQKYFDW